MKVYIGPYKRWIGPYQVFGWLEKLVGEEKFEALTEKIGPFFEWIYSKRPRKVKVRIDNYDTWNMDHTLACIILPMLKQLQESKQGAPSIDDEDVPDELKTINALPLTEEEMHQGYPDNNWFKRWDYVLEEMIYSFEYILGDEEYNYKDEERLRCSNGLKLFGKYYRGLWD